MGLLRIAECYQRFVYMFGLWFSYGLWFTTKESIMQFWTGKLCFFIQSYHDKKDKIKQVHKYMVKL